MFVEGIMLGMFVDNIIIPFLLRDCSVLPSHRNSMPGEGK